MFSNLSTVPAGSSDTSSRVTSFPRSIRSCVIAYLCPHAYRIQHQFMRASRSRSAPIAKHRASCSLAHNPRARCFPTAWPCFQIAGLLWLCTRLRPSEGQTDLARPDARAPAPRGETSLGGPARAAASRALPCSSCSGTAYSCRQSGCSTEHRSTQVARIGAGRARDAPDRVGGGKGGAGR